MAEDNFIVDFGKQAVPSKDGISRSKFKTVVKSLGIISLVVTSSVLVAMNQGWLDFGDTSGIFPVISSSENTEGTIEFKEGYPINFNTTVYMVDTGEITTNSIDNSVFRDDLNITWYLKRDGWSNFCAIDSGSGLTEFTTSCLKPGTYTVKVEVEGISKTYDILTPQDYATTSEAQYIYNEMVFEIIPLAELKAYILSPQDFSNFVEGDSVSLTGYANRYLNNSLVKLISTKSIEEYNNAKNWIDPAELRETLSSQMSEILVNETIKDFEFIDPIKLCNYNVTDVEFKWYDDFVDADERQYPINFLGEGKNFEVSGLEVGYHSITLKVFDEKNKEQETAELHFWISALEQPSVPYVMPFSDNADLDGNVLMNWDRSSSNFNGINIDHYELQKENHIGNFHPGTGSPYIEGVDYFSIPGNRTYNYFTGLETSTSLINYQDGKHWFRVRAVDTKGSASFWSIPIGITINDAPNNVTCSGIYNGGSRVDFQTGYQSTNGEIILNDKPAELQYEISMPNKIFYDFIDGQFENEATRYDVESITFTQRPLIYQYQDFTVNFASVSGDIDQNEADEDLIFYIYSDYDGLIFKGTGFSESNPISWTDDIIPYLRIQTGENFPKLSPYLHSITIVIRDNYDISYQLPSLLLNVTYLEPEWQSIAPQGIPDMFYDSSGDGKMDWDQYGIEWEYPHFNQYMPNETLGPEDEAWEDEAYKLLFWEIEVFFSYGENTYNESIIQTNPEPRHYWYYTNDIVDDSISPWGLVSGNYSFRVRAVDCNFLYSEWSDNATILNNTGDPLSPPFDKKLPILLNEDNPPPCAWIDFVDNHGIYGIITGESISLSGLNSSDANGDALSYTWKFDGVVREDLLPDFDPYQPNITINPEWIGNDIDILNDEIDLSDGDNYGDFGEHIITLEVSDGVSTTKKSINVFIVPKNFVPTFDIAYTGGTMTGGILEIYEGYSLSLSLDNVIHYDHEVQRQNISVTLLREDLVTGQLETSKSFIITSEELNQNANVLNFGYMEEQGFTHFEDLAKFGLFNYTFILDDGEEMINKSIIVQVLEDVAPEQLSVELLDLGGNNLYNGSSYIAVPGQALILNLDWIHAPAYELLDIAIESSDHDFTVYSYDNNKQINLAASNIYFNSPGQKIITVSITDRSGNSVTISIPITIMVPTIFADNMKDSVETTIQNRIQGGPNYDNLNRKASDVPDWFMRLGDNNPDTGDGYFINDVIESIPIPIPSADYLRVWFQLDARIEDRLEFYDGSNQLIWTIRRTIKFGDYRGEYQYKDKNGVWQILPQMSFLDDSNQINTNNRFDWDIDVDDRLVYVVIPGDTFSIKWITGGRSFPFTFFFLNNVFGLEGFKIAYFEAWGEKSLELSSPLELPTRNIIDRIGGPDTLAGKIFNKAWPAFLESFELDTFDVINSMWIGITREYEFDNLKFGIDVQYNLFTNNLIIIGSVEYEIEEIRLAKFLNDLDFEFSGYVLIDILLNTGTINKFEFGVYLALSKTWTIADILMMFVPTAPIGLALNKYNDFVERYRVLPLPKIEGGITLSIFFSLIGGWSKDLGSFLYIRLGVSAAISLIFKMVNIAIGLTFNMNWVQNQPLTMGLSFWGSLSIIVNPRNIFNFWPIPNWNIFVLRREI